MKRRARADLRVAEPLHSDAELNPWARTTAETFAVIQAAARVETLLIRPRATGRPDLVAKAHFLRRRAGAVYRLANAQL